MRVLHASEGSVHSSLSVNSTQRALLETSDRAEKDAARREEWMTTGRTGDSWCGQVVATQGQEEKEKPPLQSRGRWMERMVLRNK